MALLAWIVLTLSPLAGARSLSDAMTMGSMSGHGMQGTSLHAGQHDACCGSVPLHAGCQCVSMCGAALLPAAIILPATSLLPADYAMLRGTEAPGSDPNPPLRPPAA